MMSDDFRNYGIRDKESAFRNADVAGRYIFEVARRKSPLYRIIVAMFMKICLGYAFRGTEGEHHLLKHELFIVEDFMLLNAAWIGNISLQIRSVPLAESFLRRATVAVSARAKAYVWNMVPIGAVMDGFIARTGKI